MYIRTDCAAPDYRRESGLSTTAHSLPAAAAASIGDDKWEGSLSTTRSTGSSG